MSSASYDTDVLVLGGGPAGSAAAITAVNAGLSAIIIEREVFPRPAPGESAHPGVQPLLRQLGVEAEVLSAGFLRHPGYLVRSGASRHTWLSGQTKQARGWDSNFGGLISTQSFCLEPKPPRQSVFQPAKATGLIFENGEIGGITTPAGRIRSRFVIDATGRWRAVTRWLNLAWKRHRQARRPWYGYALGSCTAREEVPLFAADAEGWTWIARVSIGHVRLDSSQSRWVPPSPELVAP